MNPYYPGFPMGGAGYMPQQFPQYQQPPTNQQPLMRAFSQALVASCTEEVNSVPVPPGETYMFMNSQHPRFWIKKADEKTGATTVAQYEFQEYREPSPAFVDRKEFDDLKEKYESLVARLDSAEPAHVESRSAEQPAAGPVYTGAVPVHAAVPGNPGAGAAGGNEAGPGYGHE